MLFIGLAQVLVPLSTSWADGIVTPAVFPKSLQLYPRNVETNLAVVPIEGTASGSSSARVQIWRDGVLHDTLIDTDGGDFAFYPEISAELAGYDFILFQVDGATQIEIMRAEDVVAGDLFLVQGQSNAVAPAYDEPANPTEQNRFVRSYGTAVPSAQYIVQYQDWVIADGDGANSLGTIGQWALRMGNLIVQNHGVPVAIINGALGGQPISHFQRNDANIGDLETNYGRLLYRVQQAELQDDVRGIFWYQGESDVGDYETHIAGFKALYADWKADYPTVEQIYLFQTADACFQNTQTLRDRQRRLGPQFTDITLISTNAVDNHRSDCHYNWLNGYQTLGERAYRLVARDYYGGPAQDVAAPDLDRAYFSNADRSEITLRLRDVTSSTLTVEPEAIYRFGLDADEFTFITSGPVQSGANELVIGLNRSVPEPLTILYYGDSWAEVTNANDDIETATGHGMLAFEAEVYESYGAPDARFDVSAETGVVPLTIDFDASASDDRDGSIAAYTWEIDGAHTADGVTTTHTFTMPGSYTVELVVTDDEGNQHRTQQTILATYDTLASCETHGLTYERFDNIIGAELGSLLSHPSYPDAPSSTQLIADFEIPADAAENYGGRVRGYLVAPITGNYRFWVASDDQSQLFLSSDDSAENAVDLVSINAYTPPRQWENASWPWFSTQRSAEISLIAGERYYIEALYKEAQYGDHLSLAWQVPNSDQFSLITHSFLCALNDDGTFAPTADFTIDQPASLPPVEVAFDGSGSADVDGTIEQIEWRFGDHSPTQTAVTTTTHVYHSPGDYAVDLTVIDNDGLTDTRTQTVSIAAPTCDAGGLLFERWDGVSGATVADLVNHPSYPNAPTAQGLLDTFELPGGEGETYGVRVRGYLTPPADGAYQFRLAADNAAELWLSSDDSAESLTLIAASTTPTSSRAWLSGFGGIESAEIELQAGQRYYIEARYKQNAASDHLSVAWQQPDSDIWRLITCPHIEPLNVSPLSIAVSVTASKTALPSSGSYIEYTVIVTNTSPAETWQTPIQIEQYLDSAIGEIAPIPAFYENDCWWWLPQLWPGQSWTCRYNHFSSTPDTHLVTVTGSIGDGEPIIATDAVTIIEDNGPGVLSNDAWESTIEMPPMQSIDSDQDGVRDTNGVLIGDYNFNGLCDMYEIWWSQTCIPLTEADVVQALATNVTDDQRLTLMRSLLATWLNVLAGNDYGCASIGTAINLSAIWLTERAPDGNPLHGGTPVLTGAEWDAFSWAHNWMTWFNETGGACAGTQQGASAATASSSVSPSFTTFTAPTFLDSLTAEQQQALDAMLMADPSLRDAIAELYLEMGVRVMHGETVSAEMVASATAIYHQLQATAPPELQSALTMLWLQLALPQYTSQDAGHAWQQINAPHAPTSVYLSSITANSPTLIIWLIAFLLLARLTYLLRRRS